MRLRTVTSAAILAALILLMFASHTVVYPIALSLLAVIAVFEIMRVFELHKCIPLGIPAYILAAALPQAAYFLREDFPTFVTVSFISVFVFMIYLFSLTVFSKGKLTFANISGVFIMITYVSAAFGTLCAMRHYDSAGLYYIMIVFLASWITDVFAYLTGYLFGKHKLIPEVSPKKTVEGAIGGVVFAVLFMILFGFVVSVVTENIPEAESMKPDYLVLGILGAVLSVISQMGDLFASVIKREHGAKDYGVIFPGHGGVMDRFDSILLVALVTMVICMFVKPFVAVL